jgi:UDP-N-acetyl-D-glucosamine/UDP-N-acetyl-D-galactosamine dehydrogenase
MNYSIGIIGLGYVGLPLAIAFGEKYNTIGFDINTRRISELLKGKDTTLEVSEEVIKEIKKLSFSSNKEDIQNCNIYIVTVPTPIDKYKKPDLSALINACEIIGKYLKTNNIIIFESTVYPGATEEVCIPVLEKVSELKFNVDFFCGYSPERVNPGDKNHTITSIKKVTSGSTKEIANKVDELYKSIITAGTHKVSSIKIAEAAKVIENTQRDINIALINELALIFKKLNIDTEEVLEAAKTKWNFLPFNPGLVGGHCIGVDPYYLTYKAISLNYNPEMILAGRRLNDSMGIKIVEQVLKLMTKKRINLIDAKILVMGLSFKENCPDIRNTKIIDIINELTDCNCKVDVYDPWVNKSEVFKEYGFNTIDELCENRYDGIIIAVSHDAFRLMTIDKIKKLGKKTHVIYDVKYLFKPNDVDGRL